MFGLDGFTLLHIAISLVGIGSGLVLVGGLMSDRLLAGSAHVFLATTLATSVTGFLFPFTQLLPSHVVGIVSLAALAPAIYAFYVAHLAGPWRRVFVVAATAALYLNAFVLVVQTFVKNPALARLAPTQSELPFVAVQGATLAAFLLAGYLAWSAFGGLRRNT